MFLLLINLVIFTLVLFIVLSVKVLFNMNFMLLVFEVFLEVSEICFEILYVGIRKFAVVML